MPACMRAGDARQERRRPASLPSMTALLLRPSILLDWFCSLTFSLSLSPLLERNPRQPVQSPDDQRREQTTLLYCNNRSLSHTLPASVYPHDKDSAILLMAIDRQDAKPTSPCYSSPRQQQDMQPLEHLDADGSVTPPKTGSKKVSIADQGFEEIDTASTPSSASTDFESADEESGVSGFAFSKRMYTYTLM